MEFSTTTARAEAVKADAIAVGVFADGELTPSARVLDKAASGAVKGAILAGDMTGKRGTLVTLRNLAGVAAPRVVLVGLGVHDDFGDRAYADAVRAAVKACPGIAAMAVAATEWKVKGRDARWHACQFAIAARETVFRSDELKSKKDDANGLARALLLHSAGDAAERGIKQGTAVANGMALTKRLGNLPPNICTPSFLGDEARRLAKDWKLGVEVLETKELEREKMNGILTVGRGSVHPPRLIVLEQARAAASGPLVRRQGHHVRFRRHLDQAGREHGRDEARHVRRRGGDRRHARGGVARPAAPRRRHRGRRAEHARRQPGRATSSARRQDDRGAEHGRRGPIVLSDALHLRERFKPDAIIDLATLTGACVVALGNVNSGLFAQR